MELFKSQLKKLKQIAEEENALGDRSVTQRFCVVHEQVADAKRSC